MNPMIPNKLYIINIGIRLFYETAIHQQIEAVHVNWMPPPSTLLLPPPAADEEIDKEVEEILKRIGDE